MMASATARHAGSTIEITMQHQPHVVRLGTLRPDAFQLRFLIAQMERQLADAETGPGSLRSSSVRTSLPLPPAHCRTIRRRWRYSNVAQPCVGKSPHRDHACRCPAPARRALSDRPWRHTSPIPAGPDGARSGPGWSDAGCAPPDRLRAGSCWHTAWPCSAPPG